MFELGATVIDTTTGERVVFKGQSWDGKNYVIGRAGSTESETVPASTIIATSESVPVEIVEEAVSAFKATAKIRQRGSVKRAANLRFLKANLAYAKARSISATEATKEIKKMIV